MAACIISSMEGLCRHKSGNLSLYDRQSALLLITPSGLPRQRLTADDIIVTDLSGSILENLNQNRPSIELMMHAAIYEARPDVSAVVHTHSPYAAAFAVKGIPIPPVVSEAVFYGQRTAIAAYAPPGSTELARLAAEAHGDCDVCLLKNHGLTAVADSLENAYSKAAYAEDVARIALLSKLLD